ncbi:alpha/beta-hydrolase, partial [Aureobasidium melanogenum]
LIRQFLAYASQHTVEDIQAFTGQWVPTPTWVKLDEVPISDAHLQRSADIVKAQLGPVGLQRVGGQEWWQWRRPEIALKGEWIEMRQDYNDRMAAENKADRIILYVHGGAYYFGSVDEHRYQMQRHARKLKARLFAPRYRLAPQFPFPCGLHDCIAAYLHVIEQYDPSTVLLGGDSAGGGMVINMLVTLRDQG